MSGRGPPDHRGTLAASESACAGPCLCRCHPASVSVGALAAAVEESERTACGSVTAHVCGGREGCGSDDGEAGKVISRVGLASRVPSSLL